MPATRIILVEDDRQYRGTLERIFGGDSDVTLVDGFSCTEDLRSAEADGLISDPPDVILLDIGLPGEDGISAIPAIKRSYPDAAILMLTIDDSSSSLKQALRAGASGYLIKDSSIEEIIESVKTAAQGGMLVQPVVVQMLREIFFSPDQAVDYGLTRREQDVLRLMRDGLAQKEIGDRLNISPYTVANHCRHIYEKLNVKSGTHAVAKAVRDGVI